MFKKGEICMNCSKVKKKLISVLTVVTLVTPIMPGTSLIAQANSNPSTNSYFHNDYSEDSLQYNSYDVVDTNFDSEVDVIERAIEALYEYGRVENGLAVFDQVPFGVFHEFGYDLIHSLIESVDEVNELAKDGEVIINDDLTIIEKNLGAETFSTNRNRNAFVRTTFTNRHYMTRSMTTSQISRLRTWGAFSPTVTFAWKIPIVGKPASAAIAITAVSANLQAARLTDRLNDSRTFGTILVTHRASANMTFTTHVQ